MHENWPLVSVLLPFTRVDKYLEEAAQSIYLQTYTNLEILFLDNQKINAAIEFKVDDMRAKVVDCRGLNSLSQVLNRGLKLSNGLYIARMDSDDISELTRLEKQVQYMESHKMVGVLGTAIQEISEIGARLKIRIQPTTHEGILSKIAFNNPFFHPTVMIRSECLAEAKGPYSVFFTRAQDYELWTRLLTRTKGANLAEPLVKYRLHPMQFGRRVANESVFYFRIAQLKFIASNHPDRSELNLGLKTYLLACRNLVVAFLRFTGPWLKQKTEPLRDYMWRGCERRHPW